MNKKKSIVVLTGAGISAESGIKTFRGADGLWENHRIEDVASIEGYVKNPTLVQEFYNQRRRQLQQQEVQPNKAHLALAELEKEWQGSFLIVTQNVDNLHERGGSQKVLHMHGELLKARCTATSQVYPWLDDIAEGSVCACCSKVGTLRPHIVWFGETPLETPRIFGVLRNCDLFLSVGTSGQVYPAAGFVKQVQPNARRVEINVEETALTKAFGEHRVGNASEEVPKFVREILEGID